MTRRAPKSSHRPAGLCWLSVFPALASEHIPKDVVLLPGALTRDPRVGRVELLAKALPANVSDGGPGLVASRHPLWYVARNGGDYDVLHLFHLKWETALLGLAFKLRNPRGKLYIKLDADSFIANQVSPRGRWRKPRVSDLIYTLADRLSCETKAIYRLLLDQGWSSRKLFLLPNGIERRTRALLAAKNPERSPKIITVGRLGTEQKNTERLIQSYGALPMSLRRAWSLDLIGPVEPPLETTLRDLAIAACRGGGEVNFLGPISDREQLCEMYCRASVFVLPSRWESSGLVLIEAMSAGLYSLATPVGCAPDLLHDLQLGLLLPEGDALFASELQQALETQIDPEIIKERSAGLIRDWDSIASALIDEIMI